MQNLGTWKKRQPPHPHTAEAFPETLGDAVGRRERLDRWVRGAGVRRARVYPGPADPTGGALSLWKAGTQGRTTQGRALLPGTALSSAGEEVSRTKSVKRGVDTHRRTY